MQNIPVLAALRVLRPWLQTGANGRQKFRFLWHDHDKDKDPNEVVLNYWYFIFVSIAKKKQTKTGANPLANSSLACSHCNSSVNWGPTHRNTLSSMRNCSLLFLSPFSIDHSLFANNKWCETRSVSDLIPSINCIKVFAMLKEMATIYNWTKKTFCLMHTNGIPLHLKLQCVATSNVSSWVPPAVQIRGNPPLRIATEHK